MTEAVWDASAILAVLNREPGWEQLLEMGWATGWVSAVNLSEVAAKLADSGLTEDEVAQVLSAIELKVHPFEESDAFHTGVLRPLTRTLGLSLGDRACLALGIRLQKPVITTDRAWRNLELPVEVRLYR